MARNKDKPASVIEPRCLTLKQAVAKPSSAFAVRPISLKGQSGSAIGQSGGIDG